MKRFSVTLIAAALSAGPLIAQENYNPRPPVPTTGIPVLDEARRRQRMFEDFRVEHLPEFNGKGKNAAKDVQQVGRFVYWYDESEPAPPPEPASIGAQRDALISLLDTAAAKYPQDDWTAGQRIRYLSEAGRVNDEISAALACKAEGWWCAALLGFAYHDARKYVFADSAFAQSLRLMSQRMRCDWSDASVLLDEYTLRTYHRTQCGSPERLAFEARLWWLAKPLYGREGLDTRTEYLSRMTMARMLEDAPSAHQFGFDIDERELLLRFGWPRAWSLDGKAGMPRGGYNPVTGMGRGAGGGMDPGMRGGDLRGMVVGHEPAPSIQFLPPATVSISPAATDSADWETGFPPVHARYAPMYARHLYGLVHQSAMFRRGDTSLVALSWDATNTPLASAKDREMALIIAHADSLKPVVTRVANAPVKGTMLGRGPWGRLLMSAEMTATGMDSAARARYGLKAPYAMGARVTLSEMMFYEPFGNDAIPATLEEAVPHMLPTIRVRNDKKLGVFFESYGTNPAGEKLKITLTVTKEDDEPGFFRRRLPTRISDKGSPIRITIEDQSIIGARMTPRAAYLDIRTLKKGSYIVQLSEEVGGQYVVYSERALEVFEK